MIPQNVLMRKGPHLRSVADLPIMKPAEPVATPARLMRAVPISVPSRKSEALLPALSITAVRRHQRPQGSFCEAVTLMRKPVAEPKRKRRSPCDDSSKAMPVLALSSRLPQMVANEGVCSASSTRIIG